MGKTHRDKEKEIYALPIVVCHVFDFISILNSSYFIRKVKKNICQVVIGRVQSEKQKNGTNDLYLYNVYIFNVFMFTNLKKLYFL